MLFFLNGRYGLAAKVAIGVIALVLGILSSARLLTLLGAVLLAWAVVSAGAALWARRREDREG